jgi:K(+)-stimulated pyrophosphate-energized sodium pump
MELLWSIPVAGVLAILFVIYLARNVLSRDTGTTEMQEIGNMIYEGAMAFLRRQYRTIAILAVVAAVVVGILVAIIGPRASIDLGWHTAVAFLVGAACSGISGFTGMFVAVKSNLRTAAAAQRSLNDAVQTSLRGGAVSGFLVVALSLIGVAGIFAAYGGFDTSSPTFADVPFLIVGFGFGASFVALFAQLGGGIYTKAADMGADLVGKVEAGIPEDDPRNAAVVADLVGDNVGDCAGRGADLFESTAAENIGAMILGVAIYTATKNPAWIFFPLVVRSFGLVACMVGLMTVRAREDEDPMQALNRGYYVCCALSAIAVLIVAQVMLNSIVLGICGIVGIITSIFFVFITQYYTAGSWRPVQEIARAARTGPATVIVSGVAVGFETTAATALVIGAALIASFFLGAQANIPGGVPVAAGIFGNVNVESGLFGTAVATMGMLMTAAFILAEDTFGPITDNAGGITEMSHQPENVRRITDSLDAVGNTTKALTKGYAIASAGLAAFLLFRAYLDEVRFTLEKAGHAIEPASFPNVVNIGHIEVFVGALLGAMLVYLFSSLAIRAVGNTAGAIIEEVRRQFRSDPGIMAGTVRPEFGRVVDITTRSALRQMVVPGVLAVAAPIVVGLILKAEATAAFLMVGTIAGILLATVLNNSGGTWDNAKKFIEAGNMKDETGQVVGKATPMHAAAVVGDTVGDPFKDTAGPSLHVLIKLLATITLVLAPLFVG